VTVVIGEYQGEHSPAEVFEEIAQAREDWAGGGFGEVRGYPGDPLPAPPLPPVLLRPR
jgi:hypothetical protein